jgi:Phospholipase_D-nuclease N-terminal
MGIRRAARRCNVRRRFRHKEAAVLFIRGGLGLLLLGLWVFCIVDVIMTDESRIRNMPKLLWLLVVLVLPDIGSILWLVAGHPWQQRAVTSRIGQEFPEYDRPGRHVAANPEDDAAFLRGLRARAEEQRRRAAEERRAREQDTD